MPEINSLSLSIVIDGSSKSNCVVDYTIVFDDIDKAFNVPFTERCFLRGSDSGIFGSDDDIPNGVMREATIRPNGQTAVTRHLEQLMSNSDLDEDVGGDEIYARVTLKSEVPLLPFTVESDSNIVEGNF